jgi:Stress responsive A/B Barrel Domain
MIRHIVTWKLTAADADERATAIDHFCSEFAGLPALVHEIKHLRVAHNVVDVPANDDLVLIVDFDDMHALEAYQAHPEHKRVAGVALSLAAKRSAIDFEV